MKKQKIFLIVLFALTILVVTGIYFIRLPINVSLKHDQNIYKYNQGVYIDNLHISLLSISEETYEPKMGVLMSGNVATLVLEDTSTKQKTEKMMVQNGRIRFADALIRARRIEPDNVQLSIFLRIPQYLKSRNKVSTATSSVQPAPDPIITKTPIREPPTKSPPLVINTLSNTTGWSTYNDTYDGLNLTFKYPPGYDYFDEDFSSPLSVFPSGQSSSYPFLFEINRSWVDADEPYYGSGDFIDWYQKQTPFAYDQYTRDVLEIDLPHKKVYRFTISYNDRIGADEIRYIMIEGGVLLNATKGKSMSSQDFYTVLDSVGVLGCEHDCTINL